MKSRTLLCVVSALFLASLAWGQSKTTGTLGGSVTDATDAVVPGAKVTLTNTETGATFEATTDDQGQYRIPLLPPGAYDVAVDKQGFGRQVHKGVTVTVGESAVADFKLVVGATTQA